MLALALLAAVAQAPDTVRYAIAFLDRVHHEASVTVDFPATGRDTLEVWMSRSSPGRYAVHEFAKNVYRVHASDPAGGGFEVIRRDPYRWLVVNRGRPVRFRYTLFGDRADGTYAQIDPTHAHLNGPATWVWARGLEAAPVALHFVLPGMAGWRVATQLRPTGHPERFTAPDLQYLMDSPVELSDFALRTWTVARPDGGRDTVRLAIHHLGTEAEVDAYAEKAERIVAEEIGLFGGSPPFDHGTYTFIADYLPWASGDGMEHRNSTILSSSASLAQAADGLLGTVSHEFFHAWNVERIRPAALEPFDFTRANPSDALWFAEGFTSYVDDLFRRRAGLMDDAGYAEALGGLVDGVVNTPARGYASPAAASLQAPFVDAASSIDPTNLGNTFYSYYPWGAATGLALDLTLRSRFPGKSLDGFFRRVWERYGRSDRPYAVARPYTLEDLERELAGYADDPAWARQFFARHVRGGFTADYGELLAHAGFLVRRAHPGAAWLGFVNLRWDSAGALVLASTPVETPFHEAGLDRGDRIVALAGTPFVSDSAWQAIRAAHRPGDSAALVLERRGGRTETVTVQFAEDPRLEVVPFEAAGRELTAAQRAFRAAWLGSLARR